MPSMSRPALFDVEVCTVFGPEGCPSRVAHHTACGTAVQGSATAHAPRIDDCPAAIIARSSSTSLSSSIVHKEGHCSPRAHGVTVAATRTSKLPNAYIHCEP
eukprot:3345111-Prymnesium_polylepis.2